MTRTLATLAALLAACPAAGQTGALRGTVAGAKAAFAIDRDTGKRYPAVLKDGGAFEVAGLPLAVEKKTADGETESAGGVYDLVIDYPGVRLEGVNLAVRRSDFEEEQPLTDDGRKKVVGIMKHLSQFEDEFNVLAVEGNIQHAVVFVSKVRTKPFYNSKPGEVTWRAEVWHFLRVRPDDPEDPWIKSPDELGVLHYRERLQQADFARKAIAFDPALGGLRLTAQRPAADVGAVKAPAAKAGLVLRDSRKASD